MQKCAAGPGRTGDPLLDFESPFLLLLVSRRLSPSLYACSCFSSSPFCCSRFANTAAEVCRLSDACAQVSRQRVERRGAGRGAPHAAGGRRGCIYLGGSGVTRGGAATRLLERPAQSVVVRLELDNPRVSVLQPLN